MKNLMPRLQKMFMEPAGFEISPPIETTGKPRVIIRTVKGKTRVTFQLTHLVPGQTFLGIYPAAATLPPANELNVGDYALLASGEVLQIL